MPSLEAVEIRKILDSRGDPTIEVDVLCEGARGRAAAPSGASTGTHEVKAFPEGGVDTAIARFREDIEPRIIGLDVTAQKEVDRLLQQIDGTPNFSRIGGNVAVAVSLAVAKAAADSLGLPLYRYVGGAFAHHLPHPMGNIIGGGPHAIGGTTIQEFLAGARGPPGAGSPVPAARGRRVGPGVIPRPRPSSPLGRGDEGAWVAPIADEDALVVLSEAW